MLKNLINFFSYTYQNKIFSWSHVNENPRVEVRCCFWSSMTEGISIFIADVIMSKYRICFAFSSWFFCKQIFCILSVCVPHPVRYAPPVTEHVPLYSISLCKNTARASGGENNMHPLSWWWGGQKIRSNFINSFGCGVFPIKCLHYGGGYKLYD